MKNASVVIFNRVKWLYNNLQDWRRFLQKDDSGTKMKGDYL